MKRRIVSVLMALVMVLSLLPVQALAEDAAVGEPVTEIEQAEQIGEGKEPGDPEEQTGEGEEPGDPEEEQEPEEPEEPEEPDSQGDQDQYHTDPVPQGKPQPVEPEETKPDTSQQATCTISISCATILNNMDKCEEAKRALIPAGGTILAASTVTFSPGESVFDVLQRVCRERKIPMEFSWTPIYNSAYIEGIYNLYEFDVGDGSGWMYKVNDWFPNYGCSGYTLQDGDVICWVYTCDLGEDVGGGYAAGGE